MLNRLILIAVICFMPIVETLAQAILTLDNGGIINIGSGAYVVVDNSATNAITRNTSGHIVTEGKLHRLVWYTKTNTGTYVIPFGRGTTEYIPLTFTITVAGTESSAGNGRFVLNTYRTSNWQNSADLPPGVANFLAAGLNNDAKGVDRFWRLNGQNGYSVYPTLSNVVFTYLDAEIGGSNTITEANLGAQRWNSTLSDWGDLSPQGTVNAAANTLTVASLAPAHLFPWWSIVDKTSPLPVSLLDFSSVCNNGIVQLNWSTANEINNAYFEIEKSYNGTDYSPVKRISGKGTVYSESEYTWTDEQGGSGTVYYRLSQTDFDGTLTVLKTISREVCASSGLVQPVNLIGHFSGNTLNFSVQNESSEQQSLCYLFDVSGKLIHQERITLSKGLSTFRWTSELPAGIYFLKLENGTGIKLFKAQS